MDSHHAPVPDARQGQPRGEMGGMDQGMRVLSYLIAGVLVYGGLGWWGDHYLGTRFLLPMGIVLGAAGGCYVIIRRYGQVPDVSGIGAGPKVSAQRARPIGETSTTDSPSTLDRHGMTNSTRTLNGHGTTNQKREGAR